MMANPVSFQPGDDVKVVYLYKKPTINNMIGTVVTHVRDQADMVEVLVDRRLYAYILLPYSLQYLTIFLWIDLVNIASQLFM